MASSDPVSPVSEGDKQPNGTSPISSSGELDPLKAAQEEIARLKSKLELQELTSQTLLASKKELEVARDALQQQVDLRVAPSPFVLALIDGDDTLFLDSFVKDAADGGRRAADELRSAISDLLELDGTARLVVQIFHNASTVKDGYSSAGISGFSRFIGGLNGHQRLTKYIDAGDDVQEEIEAMLDLFWEDRNCKHVVLACSADKYAGVLRRYSDTPKKLDRMTLIESVPAKELTLSTRRLPHLFRSSKLESSPARPATAMSFSAKTQLSRQPSVMRPGSALQRDLRLNRSQSLTRPGTAMKSICSARHCLTHCAQVSEFEDSDVVAKIVDRIANMEPCALGSACRECICVTGHPRRHDTKVILGQSAWFSGAQGRVDSKTILGQSAWFPGSQIRPPTAASVTVSSSTSSKTKRRGLISI